MKKLILAEKPSVGREIARVLGCRNQGRFFESEQYVVTWALGHLVTLCSPDFYGEEYRRWNLRNLPILPEKLELKVIDKTKDQFKLVNSLLNREDIESIVIATDAGREGELVARWIIQMANCKKRAERLWISSQTDQAIKEGFASLKPAENYDRLFRAAFSRSAADWYIGFNVSRAMSCWYDSRLSAGRVQTPTLALMTKREDEIENFEGRFYWTLKADFGKFNASRYSNENTIRIQTEEEVNSIKDKLQGKNAIVKKIDKTLKEEKPPLAYDLTALQQDANTILGFSAKETLDVLQRLYEVHKIVTYPRTDSRYITADIVPTINDRLKALAATDFGLRATAYATAGFREDLDRLVNDNLVSDHHALLPTEQKVDISKLSSKEKALWELVILRFLETISPNYEYSSLTIELESEGEKFIYRGTAPVEQGWRNVARDCGRRSACPTSDEDENGTGPENLTIDEQIPINDLVIKRLSTPAPERYTEATLLAAMEHAGRFVEDQNLKKNLTNGLGTPATRADIIEKLIKNSCIVREDKYLVPTNKGRELVRLVPEQLQSPELTGTWEQRLSLISEGKENDEDFIRDIKQNAKDLINQIKSSKLRFDPTKLGNKKCPYCEWPMVKVLDEYERVHYVCQRFSCGYEEMEVKKKVEKTPVVQGSVHVTPTSNKVIKVAVHKKRAVIKKTPGMKAVLKKADEPQFTWETSIEVVRNSHFRKKNTTTNFKSRPYEKKPKIEKKYSTGGSFADFIKASEERKQRDKDKRKKK